MNNFRHRLTTLGIFSLLLGLATACENPDDNSLEKIRSCVDGASRQSISDASGAATTAGTCETMANSSSLQGKEITEIKFGIILLKEQKLSQIAAMATGLSNSTTANHDGINIAVQVMVFSSGLTPIPDATNIQNLGNQLRGAAQTLGNLIQFSTTLNQITGGFGTDPNAVYTSLNSCSTSGGGSCPAQVPALAASARGLESGACASAADQASTDKNNLCFKMKAALGNPPSSNDQAVVDAIAAYAATTH